MDVKVDPTTIEGTSAIVKSGRGESYQFTVFSKIDPALKELRRRVREDNNRRRYDDHENEVVTRIVLMGRLDLKRENIPEDVRRRYRNNGNVPHEYADRFDVYLTTAHDSSSAYWRQQDEIRNLKGLLANPAPQRDTDQDRIEAFDFAFEQRLKAFIDVELNVGTMGLQFIAWQDAERIVVKHLAKKIADMQKK